MRRSHMPPRSQSLNPGGPLPRYQGLRSARLVLVDGGAAPVVTIPQRRRRDTGFSPAVKLAVRKRAGNGDPDDARCEATGVWLGRHGGEVQHRDARGMGGSRLANTIVNAVLLSCEAHRLAESRDEGMNAKGFWLKNGEDPELTPIMLHDAGGSGVTVWLLEDGTYGYGVPWGAA